MAIRRFHKRPRAVRVVHTGPKSRFRRSLKRRFAKRVRAVILRTNEPKTKKVFSTDGTALADGDGTSRTVLVLAPLQNLIQGTHDDNFIGDSIWCKGFAIRGQISSANTFQQFYVRWTLVWSRLQNNFSGTGASYLSTTTSSANPTAAVPLANPPLFDTAGANPLPFTGDGFVIPFDTRNNLKVLASKTILVNSSGNNIGIKKFKIFFRINSKFQYIDSGEDLGLGSAPNYGKYGNYYIVRQVVSLANNVSSTTVGTMDYQLDVYFKDP